MLATFMESMVDICYYSPNDTSGKLPLLSAPAQIDIFIVDDEVLITQLIIDLLEDEGYSSRVFHDGASALLEIIRQPPRLLLLDIGLPVITGDELLQLIRTRGIQSLPIIIMSAGAPLQSYISQGATMILPKPFDIHTLLHSIRSFL